MKERQVLSRALIMPDLTVRYGENEETAFAVKMAERKFATYEEALAFAVSLMPEVGDGDVENYHVDKSSPDRGWFTYRNLVRGRIRATKLDEEGSPSGDWVWKRA